MCHIRFPFCFVFVGMVTLQNQKRRAFHFSPSVDADSKTNTTPKSNTNSQTSDQTQTRRNNNSNLTPSSTKDYDTATTSGRVELRPHATAVEPTESSRRPLNDLLSGNFDSQVLDLTKKIQVADTAKSRESKTVSLTFTI